MAEGDSVHRIARRLDAQTAGAGIEGSDFRHPRLATVDLAGAVITGWSARGKHLLMRVDSGLTLHSHLRMSGRWALHDPVRRWPRRVDHQARAVLDLGDRLLVGWSMPVLDLVATRDEHTAVGHLGPDLLGEDWDPVEAQRRLRRRPDRPVAAALLDQRNLAGLGNLWALELCFAGGLSPWTPVAEVDDLGGLLDTAKRWLERGLATGRMTTTGDDRRGADHHIYGRAGRACRRCGTAVAFAPSAASPTGRELWWCPGCQPGAPAEAFARRVGAPRRPRPRPVCAR